MKHNKRKGNTAPESVVLCEGLKLDTGIYDKKEKRIWALLAKGILAYLISAGTIGCVLTAAGTAFSPIGVHTVILASAVLFACMYYRKSTANIGGLLLLFLLVFFGVNLYRYINSGFYAVLNDLNDHAADFFGLSGVRVFAERINDRRLAATVSMAYLGAILAMVVNMLLIRRMRYVCAAALTLPLLLFPVYIKREPQMLYAGLLLCGLLAALAWKRSGLYEKQDSDSVYTVDKKNNISRVYHHKALFSLLLQVVVWLLVFVMGIFILKPQTVYMENQKISGLKLKTRDTVETIVLMGLTGFVNRYESTGGMSSGRLGGVGSVNLDYNTDLKLRMTPYSYDTVYLKYFTGGEYIPYENRWRSVMDKENKISEALQLRHAFLTDNETSARGTAEIENVAALIGTYLPYYSADTGTMGLYEETVDYTYYPRLAANTYPVEQEIDRDYWLSIPEENYDAVAAFCEQAGFHGSSEEIIAQVKAYYQQEIPYTLRPGATPRRQDFINYFLQNNKKGYCAHFASAAVLIFRYMGIPARYVEGYAVSYDEFLEGTLLSDTAYGDYYEGYSELGETALVEVEITDADAHAWVEIYDETAGWVVAEVTPYAAEDMRGVDFWSMFLNFLGGNDDPESETQQEPQGGQTEIDLAPLRTFFYAAVACLICAALSVCLIRLLIFGIRYLRCDRNDRLILRYRRYLHKKNRKYKELKEKQNYREQIIYLTEKQAIQAAEPETVIAVLEKAGFSNQSITPEEFRLVLTQLSLGKNKDKRVRK